MNKLIYYIALSFLFSCHSPAAKNETSVAAGSEDTARAQTTIRYAHGFTIDYHDGFKVVRILDRNNNNFDTLEYLLVQKGHPVPAGYPRSQVIPIPVQTMIA
ncbi:MAG TPA: hypothetical protein VIM64_07210, partial [Puia sp.]